MTFRDDDAMALEINNRRLEKELRAARLALRDRFAMAALPLCFSSVYSEAVAEAAFELADAMLAVRDQPCGQPGKPADFAMSVPAIVFFPAGSLGEEVAA